MAVINGTDNNDYLAGTDLADLIFGSKGADVIDGFDGDDTIDGGEDDDIYGDGGFDVLRGDKGADFLFGGADDDGLYGDDKADLLEGGYGNDVAFGDASGDSDRLFGPAGADRLVGGSGQDRLDGGLGIDRLTGGADSDVFVLARPATDRDVITDLQRGTDDLEVAAAVFGGGLSGGSSLQWSQLVVTTGAGTASVADQGAFLFNATNGVLRWDADGRGGAAAVQVATLTGVTSLSTDDFIV